MSVSGWKICNLQTVLRLVKNKGQKDASVSGRSTKTRIDAEKRMLTHTEKIARQNICIENRVKG
jgi:hypothetical protein